MTTRIQGTNIDISPALQEYVATKLDGARKLLAPINEDNVAVLDIEIARTTNHHRKGDDIYRAEFNLEVPHELLRAEETSDDMHGAILAATQELERLIKEYKDKRKTLAIKGAREFKEKMRE